MKQSKAELAHGVPTIPDGASLFAGDSYTTEENDRAGAAARDRVFAEIDRLGLRAAIGELESKGYAVIPPEIAAPPGFAERLREAVLDVSEQASGVAPDLVGGRTHAQVMSRHGQVQQVEPLIHWHPLFQEAFAERARACDCDLSIRRELRAFF